MSSSDPGKLIIEAPRGSNATQSISLSGPQSQLRQRMDSSRTPLDNKNLSKKKVNRGCLRSKPACLVLFWSLLVFLYSQVLDPTFLQYFFVVFRNIIDLSDVYIAMISFGGTAFILIFFPLSGFLADTKCGRYRVIKCGLYLILLSLGSATLVFIVMLIGLFSGVSYSVAMLISILMVCMGLLVIPVFIGFIGFVAFMANVIQFGTDQLHDAPTEDIINFISWFVWIQYLGVMIWKFVAGTTVYAVLIGDIDITSLTFGILGLVGIFLTFMMVTITLCFSEYKHHWFMANPASSNPYKLVLQVIKYAIQHKYPVQRSAFTYCEDELPTRLDLGKDKYGGPFKNEEVEDVKSFKGIVCILLSISPIFAAAVAVSGILPVFTRHLELDFDHPDVDRNSTVQIGYFKWIMCNYGSITSVLIVILIPPYLCLLRPYIYRYIPGILKRIGLGMLFVIASLFCPLIIEVIGHIHNQSPVPISCFLRDDFDPNDLDQIIGISSCSIASSQVFNALAYMFLDIATFEFVCSQSPNAMKGLLIGSLFAIKGLSQFLAIIILPLPFTAWEVQLRFPGCGFVYYLLSIVLAILGLILYTVCARRYKYRQRDEPDNIYRYAEEYYEKAQDEPNYDYDNYDNLNVETIT